MSISRYTKIQYNCRMTPEEALDLHRRYAKRKLNQYCERLFKHHFAFAVNVAVRYARPDFPAEEAISAAVNGLLEALRRYDPDKAAFTTFSYWWMLKYILQERAFAREVVRLPIGVVRKARQARRLRVKLGHDDLLIAEEMGVDVRELERIENIHSQFPRIGEINDGFWMSEDALGAHVDPAPNPAEALEQSEDQKIEAIRRRSLTKVLGNMRTRDREIIEARFRNPPVPFGVLGKRYGMTREGVRKLFVAAMLTLKSRCHGPRVD